MNKDQKWDFPKESPIDAGDVMWDGILTLRTIKEWFKGTYPDTVFGIDTVYGNCLFYDDLLVDTGMVGIRINHPSIKFDMRMRNPLIYSLFDIVGKSSEIKTRIAMYMDCDNDWIETDIPF